MKIEIDERDYTEVRKFEKVRNLNGRVLELYASYIRNCPCFITKELVKELMTECGVEEEYAYFLLLASAFDLDMEQNRTDIELAESYIRPSIKKLDIEVYKENAYYKNIKIPAITFRGWQLKYEEYKPYEAFIYNDVVLHEDFREIPRLGFFDKNFVFPAVLQDGVEWMTITPNEL